MGERVSITDVGPRDGLQNQPGILNVEERLKLIRAVAAAGVTAIEVGSFVSPKAVPAMAGTDQVVAGAKSDGSYKLSALIPNLKGYELAREAGVGTVAMVVYASETMARENAKMSGQQAMDITRSIVSLAIEDKIEVTATIAVAFACPFEGVTAPDSVVRLTAELLEMGVNNVVLADTIGAADPQHARMLTSRLVDSHGAGSIGCHFHDTRAMGLANVYAAIESGIRKFDACIAGLGGCPFAPGATGNVATEDVVMMLEQMGFDTGIDLRKLMAASDLAAELTGNAPGGRASAWLKPRLDRF